MKDNVLLQSRKIHLNFYLHKNNKTSTGVNIVSPFCMETFIAICTRCSAVQSLAVASCVPS